MPIKGADNTIHKILDSYFTWSTFLFVFMSDFCLRLMYALIVFKCTGKTMYYFFVCHILRMSWGYWKKIDNSVKGEMFKICQS